MKTVAIVPSAGHGKRLRARTKKPFVMLGGKPLVAHAIRALEESAAVDTIIIASERSCVGKFRRLIKQLRFKKVTDIIVGGKTRFESVRNCLARVSPSVDIVLIHDGARPFINTELIRKSIDLAAKFGACIVAVPETDTVKLSGADLFVGKTLDRKKIYRAQTPQAFRRDLIERAYALKGNRAVTDDSMLVEALGERVKILAGSYRNIKITTKEDLTIARNFL